MRLLLLALLLASSAAAQTPDSVVVPRARPSAGTVLGGAAAGATAVLLGTLALRVAGVPEEGRSWAVLLYPAGVAAGVYEIRRRDGGRGSFGATASGAIRGTLFSLGGALLVGYGVGSVLNESDDATAAIVAGLAVVLIAPPYAAAAGYAASEVQPVVLVGPDGERAAGASLRIAF